MNRSKSTRNSCYYRGGTLLLLVGGRSKGQWAGKDAFFGLGSCIQRPVYPAKRRGEVARHKHARSRAKEGHGRRKAGSRGQLFTNHMHARRWECIFGVVIDRSVGGWSRAVIFFLAPIYSIYTVARSTPPQTPPPPPTPHNPQTPSSPPPYTASPQYSISRRLSLMRKPPLCPAGSATCE